MGDPSITQDAGPRRWSSRRGRVAIGVGFAALVVDQATKAFFDGRPCGEVICPFRNDELMLGIIGGTALQVLLASVVGLGVFWLWVRTVDRRVPVPAVAIALVVSGIVGNLVDRLFLGSVRDFIVAPRNVVFNVADVALAVGLLTGVGTLLGSYARRSVNA